MSSRRFKDAWSSTFWSSSDKNPVYRRKSPGETPFSIMGETRDTSIGEPGGWLGVSSYNVGVYMERRHGRFTAQVLPRIDLTSMGWWQMERRPVKFEAEPQKVFVRRTILRRPTTCLKGPYRDASLPALSCHDATVVIWCIYRVYTHDPLLVARSHSVFDGLDPWVPSQVYMPFGPLSFEGRLLISKR
jgi:hypothetical protein